MADLLDTTVAYSIRETEANKLFKDNDVLRRLKRYQ